MLPRLLPLPPGTRRRLLRLSQEAERDGAYRVAKRLRAVVLNADGHTSGEPAVLLPAPRSKVSVWLQQHQTHGVEGLLEGQRSGRPAAWTDRQQQPWGEILDSGPAAEGLDGGLRTCPMVARIIGEEFGVQPHPGPVRKLRPALGFSLQRPHRVRARADAAARERRQRRPCPALKKAQAQQWAPVFTDEAGVRQGSTPHAAWGRVGCPVEVPVTGARKNVRIFGAVELWRARFDYGQETVFNATTDPGFLEQLARRYRRPGAVLIQDNASKGKVSGRRIACRPGLPPFPFSTCFHMR